MDKVVLNYLLSEKISADLYFIAIIDGIECKTLKDFLKKIGEAFKFPSYYGNNLNALNDCLNDLEWLNKPNYLLIIRNPKEFLIKEPADIYNHIIHLLEEVSTQWKNVPNYAGEEEFRKRSDFIIKMI